MIFVDVRCDGLARTGPRKGQTCNYLLHRIDPDTVGVVETKCPRCNAMRVWAWPRLPVMLLASTG